MRIKNFQYHDQYQESISINIMINIILIMILVFQAATWTIFNIIENDFFNRRIDFFNIGSSGFPVCPRCPRFHLAPPNGALAKQIATDCSLSVHDVRFRLALSQRSSLQALRAISHSFLPVQNTQRGISGIKPPQVLTEGFNAEMAISGLNPQIRFVYLVILMQKDGLKGCVLDQLLPSHLWPLRPVLDSYMSWGRYRAVSALTVHSHVKSFIA